MRLTAIFANQETRTTIETAEDVILEGLGKDPRRLSCGVTENIAVGPGVFRIIAEQNVSVTANQNLQVITMDKPGGPIELVKLIPPGYSTDEVKAFLELKAGQF